MKRITQVEYSLMRRKLTVIYEFNITPDVLQNIGEISTRLDGHEETAHNKCVVCGNFLSYFIYKPAWTTESTFYSKKPACRSKLRTVHLKMRLESGYQKKFELTCTECRHAKLYKVIPALKKELHNTLNILPLPIHEAIWEHLSYTEVNEQIEESE
jgi:hypothetical protein